MAKDTNYWQKQMVEWIRKKKKQSSSLSTLMDANKKLLRYIQWR
jgi:hypothetical protein